MSSSKEKRKKTSTNEKPFDFADFLEGFKKYQEEALAKKATDLCQENVTPKTENAQNRKVGRPSVVSYDKETKKYSCDFCNSKSDGFLPKIPDSSKLAVFIDELEVKIKRVSGNTASKKWTEKEKVKISQLEKDANDLIEANKVLKFKIKRLQIANAIPDDLKQKINTVFLEEQNLLNQSLSEDEVPNDKHLSQSPGAISKRKCLRNKKMQERECKIIVEQWSQINFKLSQVLEWMEEAAAAKNKLY